MPVPRFLSRAPAQVRVDYAEPLAAVLFSRQLVSSSPRGYVRAFGTSGSLGRAQQRDVLTQERLHTHEKDRSAQPKFARRNVPAYPMTGPCASIVGCCMMHDVRQVLVSYCRGSRAAVGTRLPREQGCRGNRAAWIFSTVSLASIVARKTSMRDAIGITFITEYPVPPVLTEYPVLEVLGS
jgi:hypothetical protein